MTRDGLTTASRAAAGHWTAGRATRIRLIPSKPQEATQNESTFRADRAVAVLGLEHFADMNAAAGRDRAHWDAALASINFAAHALASS